MAETVETQVINDYLEGYFKKINERRIEYIRKNKKENSFYRGMLEAIALIHEFVSFAGEIDEIMKEDGNDD